LKNFYTTLKNTLITLKYFTNIKISNLKLSMNFKKNIYILFINCDVGVPNLIKLE